MKKLALILLPLFLLPFSFACYAEESYLSVAMPNNCILENNLKTLFKNKLFELITSQGIATSECSMIALIPEVTIIDEKIVEGGLRNIYVQQLDITISVRHVMTHFVFNSFHLTLRGEGYSIMEARRSAIKKINVNDKECINFIVSSKNKICDYYSKNTSSIIQKANTLASQQAYDQALALLSAYPEGLDGFSLVADATKKIFNQWQTKKCSQILQIAHQAYALREYEKAAEMAALVDAQSSCASDAKKLLSQIKADLDKERSELLSLEKEKISLEREKIQSEERVQSLLITAARDVCTEYLKNQTEYCFYW